MTAVAADFQQAVEAHRVDGLSLIIEEGAFHALRASVGSSGVLLVGEMHGVAENAAIVYALMRLLGLRGLALEWENDLMGLVQRFLTSGAIALDLTPSQLEQVARFRRGLPVEADDADKTLLEAIALHSLDGRVTAEYFALLRHLHDEGLLDQLILFQAGGRDWNERDEAMASRVLREWNGTTPLLVVAGNAHTRRSDHTLGRPMGVHLVAAAPGTVDIVIDYVSGEFYNFGVKQIARRGARAAERSPRLSLRENGVYAIEIANVRPATVARPPNSE